MPYTFRQFFVTLLITTLITYCRRCFRLISRDAAIIATYAAADAEKDIHRQILR